MIEIEEDARIPPSDRYVPVQFLFGCGFLPSLTTDRPALTRCRVLYLVIRPLCASILLLLLASLLQQIQETCPDSELDAVVIVYGHR